MKSTKVQTLSQYQTSELLHMCAYTIKEELAKYMSFCGWNYILGLNSSDRVRRENKSSETCIVFNVLSYNSAHKLRMCVSFTARATVQRLSIFSPLTGSLPLYSASDTTLSSPVVPKVVAVLRCLIYAAYSAQNGEKQTGTEHNYIY